jgi:hypothetical protein
MQVAADDQTYTPLVQHIGQARARQRHNAGGARWTFVEIFQEQRLVQEQRDRPTRRADQLLFEPTVLFALARQA